MAYNVSEADQHNNDLLNEYLSEESIDETEDPNEEYDRDE